jgi:hypothetical protein
MKKFLALAVVGMLVGAMVASSADAKVKKKYSYTQTGAYTGPSGLLLDAGAAQAQTSPAASAQFPTRSTDRFVTLTVTDTSGQAVGFTYTQTPGVSQGGFTSYCGTGTKIPVTGGSDLYVYVQDGVCAAGASPSAATSGTITGKFSNR